MNWYGYYRWCWHLSSAWYFLPTTCRTLILPLNLSLSCYGSTVAPRMWCAIGKEHHLCKKAHHELLESDQHITLIDWHNQTAKCTCFNYNCIHNKEIEGFHVLNKQSEEFATTRERQWLNSHERAILKMMATYLGASYPEQWAVVANRIQSTLCTICIMHKNTRTNTLKIVWYYNLMED